MALTALARLQLNVIVEKSNIFGYFENILDDRVYLPFAWLEEGVAEPSDVSIYLFKPSRLCILTLYIKLIYIHVI